MKALNYTRLTQITNVQKPYRGTTDRYPVGDRRHNTKDFVVDTLDGDTIYRVRYGFHYDRIYHTKEQYLEDQKNGGNNIYCYEHEENEAEKYMSYRRRPFELGIVRPDNTFEFTMDTSSGQGGNIIMSSWSEGFFSRSVRHGGMIYRQGYYDNPSVFHPIFKGLRLNIEDMKAHYTCHYTTVARRVDRSKAKEFLKPYEDFFKITETMVTAMEGKDIKGIATELLEELNLETKQYWNPYGDMYDTLVQTAESYMKDRPIDSMLMFSMAYDINGLYRQARDAKDKQKYYTNSTIDPDSLYTNFRRRLGKELYSKCDDVFTKIEYRHNEPYPESTWGVSVFLDGKEVQQY